MDDTMILMDETMTWVGTDAERTEINLGKNAAEMGLPTRRVGVGLKDNERNCYLRRRMKNVVANNPSPINVMDVGSGTGRVYTAQRTGSQDCDILGR